MPPFVMSRWHQEPLASRSSSQLCNQLLGGPWVFLSAKGANTTDSLFWSLKRIIRWRKWCVCKSRRKTAQQAAYQCADPLQPTTGEFKRSVSRLEPSAQCTPCLGFPSARRAPCPQCPPPASSATSKRGWQTLIAPRPQQGMVGLGDLRGLFQPMIPWF